MSPIDCVVSVIAPLRDDADIVEAFLDETIAVLSRHYTHWEVVLVDDGSEDDTVERVRKGLDRSDGGSVRLIRLSRSFGQEIAISAGLDSVIGDFVVVMLPDSDPPDAIPAMVDQARGGAGIVFGVRQSRAGQSAAYRFGTRLFYWYARRVLQLDIPPDTTHFRVLSRQAVNALTRIRDRSRYLHTLTSYIGYLNQRFPYDLIERRPRPRRKSLMQGVRLALSITMSTSGRPLQIAAAVAIAAGGAAGAGGMVAGWRWATGRADLGWDALTLLGLAALLAVLAVLAVYVGRLLTQAAARPLYYVLEEEQGGRLMGDGDRNVVPESLGW